MSHIPTSAMLHVQAQDDAANDRPALGGDAPASEPLATAASDRASDMAAAGPSSDDASAEPPLSSAGPATATGNRAGSDASATAQAAGATATGGQSSVDGVVTARGDADAGSRAAGSSEAGLGDDRSTALLAAMVLGGLAAIGGLVAAVLPLVRNERGRKQGKGKKGKRKA